MLRSPIRLINLNLAHHQFASRTLTLSTPLRNSIKYEVQKENNDKASPEQLAILQQRLEQILPKFFNLPHDYTIYTKDVIFINNIRGTKVQGIAAYALQLSLIKLHNILKYTSSKVELLNIVKNPEESYVKIRWRVVSKPGLIRFMLFFWKFSSTEIWTDGISTMHVNNRGLINCHVCDNIDYELKESGTKDELGKSIKNPLVSRGLNV